MGSEIRTSYFTYNTFNKQPSITWGLLLFFCPAFIISFSYADGLIDYRLVVNRKGTLGWHNRKDKT